MFFVAKIIHFCYGHRLLEYTGKCRHPHGHNGKIEITMRAKKLDKLGMVMDFEDIKTTIQKWVNTELDHKMLLNAEDPLVAILRGLGEPVVTTKGNPTAENIAKLIFNHAKNQKLPVVSVKLWETVNSHAEYRG
ncbi:MAG: 6-carboxytetrahydropterin synthase QueD [Elusimicrobia bacterium RIFCSPHIGHO2_02_FULL_57_9]|nr:MAG: 6-carboxytetrahydropterin synthase QueD [Elusimicrobia bacterium RIFCSPHIGHO2_02_FULL_57_9]